tara:strand:- start:2117 stop:2926 length:810 start_codon:yes stop_codon:yes gene_type:complete
VSKIQIIADGGGTTTNWCSLQAGRRSYFSLESYHPSFWNSEFEERIKAYWNSKFKLSEVELIFFGAGCYRLDKRMEAEEMFKRIGFTDVSVLSDLHAAGFSSLGKQSGWVAIAGTGSVLFNWSGSDVLEVVGGKGRELGDEGSGHYFGKLVFEAFESNELEGDQLDLLLDRISKHDLEVLKIETRFSELSSLLVNDQGLFSEFHEQSIRLFFDSYLNSGSVSHIQMIGGYAWHLRLVFSKIAKEYNVKIDGVINEPIEPLVDQIALFTE